MNGSVTDELFGHSWSRVNCLVKVERFGQDSRVRSQVDGLIMGERFWSWVNVLVSCERIGHEQTVWSRVNDLSRVNG